MKRTLRLMGAIAGTCMTLALLVLFAGCSDENPTAPSPNTGDLPSEEDAPLLTETSNPAPPVELVTVDFAGEELTFWPYVGSSLGGAPSDPVNLILVGQADPIRIRAALLALNGDRTAFGYPDVPPFNATWSDAIGDVQATYAEGDGWTGSVIQLQLGTYDPIRWHLRLFRTGKGIGGGEWTIASAHFEVLIPGTADHQVLSWEVAEQIVIADLMRTGLLDPALPMMPTGLINQQPSFREIPAVIYNGIPDELKVYIGGPLGQVTDPVGIPTDGKAMILNVGTPAPVTPGNVTQTLTITYQQVVPRSSVMPLCGYGPMDYVLLTGPVQFEKSVMVGPRGHLSFSETYEGTLEVTPWDVVTNQPAGAPYPAVVRGLHSGFDHGGNFSVTAFDSRKGRSADGLEQHTTRLKVSVPGNDCYQVWTHCLD
jgi:hypothetical protein